MSQIHSNVAKTLNKIRTQVGAISPQSLDEIIPIGAGLEALTSELPLELEAMNDLIYLCLEGLMFIYQQPESESFPLVVRSISAAMVAAEQAAVSPNNPICEGMMENAKNSLRTALNQEQIVVSEEVEGETVEKGETFSLNDVAALIVALEPADKNNLVQVTEALKEIADNHSDNIVKKQLVKASKELQKVVNGKAADAQKVIDRVGEIVGIVLADSESAVQEELTPAAVETATIDFELEETPVIEAASVVEEEQTATVLEFYLPSDADNGLLREFLAESNEYIEAAEAALLALESDPDDDEAVNTVFRAFHTIKGTSAFLGLKHLTEFTHNAETLFSRIRDHEIRCSGDYADLALRSIDVVKAILEAVQNGLEGKQMRLPDNFERIIKVLANPEAAGLNSNKITVKPEEATPTVPVKLVEKSAEQGRLGDILVAQNKVSREQIEAAIAANKGGLVGSTLVQAGLISPNDVQDALQEQKKGKGGADSSVRVQTEKLDSLINMIGELVVAQSILVQDEAVLEDDNFLLARKVAHVGKIVRELQDLSMAMRMIPLKSSFQKVARVVRDVAQKCGKLVEFVTEGEDTEIDRNMVDIIADPLIHMVRNSVDHGIETPDERAKAGKNRTGRVRISAYHAGGNVVVELADDGKGLDRDRILEKAIAKGLIESEKGMSDSDIYNLVFAPGFSTAEAVTDVSGRGVGMDVVRRNIEAMHGRIEIASEKGKGCTFTLRLPLTLAITDGMLVRVGEEHFIVPTLHIHLSFRPNKENISTVVGRGEMLLLRGELMPVFRLHSLFNIKNAQETLEQGLLMILTDGNKRCALLVDELLGQQQVVAKPLALGAGMSKVQGLSGGAILGDGSVGLILDSGEIIALARQTNVPERKNESLKLVA